VSFSSLDIVGFIINSQHAWHIKTMQAKILHACPQTKTRRPINQSIAQGKKRVCGRSVSGGEKCEYILPAAAAPPQIAPFFLVQDAEED
jgi:hypothetical protein